MNIKKRLHFTVIVLVMFLFASANAFAVPKTNNGADKETKSKKKVKIKKSYKDGFFQMARFIMTKEEKEIYKHLADDESKLQFIEDFWDKRDPSPSTEENESKDEFYLRIAFANKWFNEYSKGRGWDTERGRILLQLGFPDKREFGNAASTYRGRLVTSKRVRAETWIYYRYNLVLYFQGTNDAASRLNLIRIPPELPAALDRIKYTMNLSSKKNLKKSFKFDAQYKGTQFDIYIPVKKISFAEESDSHMKVDFQVSIYAYKNNKRFDKLELTKTLNIEKAKLLNMKNVEFSIPYTLAESGNYYFDVIIEEKSSAEKFRDFAKYKF